MKIERITDQAIVTTIMEIDDPRLIKYVLAPVGATLIEYTQFLTDYVKHEDYLRIWGVVELDKLKYYIVAVNAVLPPISRRMLILYQNFYAVKNEQGHHMGALAEKEVEVWGRTVGAIGNTTQTNKPHVMSLFGYRQEKGCVVVRDYEK